MTPDMMMAPGDVLRGRAITADRTGFLSRVYLWMTLGLGVTGLVALFTLATPTLLRAIAGNRMLFYGILLAELGAVLAFRPIAARASFGVAAAVFFGYAALNGLTFSILFLVYTTTSIAGVFFVTAGTFGALSLYGALTKRDLTSVGSFMMMGLVGIIIASVVNLFLGSAMVAWVASFVGVIVFTGLTAYDTQRILALGNAAGSGADAKKAALSGALILYLDFVNLFLSILHLFGKRR